MKSFTESVALLNSLSKVPSADTTTTSLLTQLWNDSVRTMCNIRGGKLRFLEDTKTVATVASQEAYAMPGRSRKIINLYVTVGTTKYLPRPIYDPNEWHKILAANLAASDIPLYYYVEGNQFRIAPTPATTAGTITLRTRLNIRDLTAADVAVSVTDLANGGTAATIASGGLASMAGKFLRITFNSAASKGDGFWYEIASASATTINLVAPYEGTTLTGATAAGVVGEMTPIPEAYDMGPIYRALALFNQTNDPLHPQVAQSWWRLYDGGQEIGLTTLPGGLVGQMLENEGETTEGAYVSPYYGGSIDPNDPPLYPLSGF